MNAKNKDFYSSQLNRLTKSPFVSNQYKGLPSPPPTDFLLLDDTGDFLLDDTEDFLLDD